MKKKELHGTAGDVRYSSLNVATERQQQPAHELDIKDMQMCIGCNSKTKMDIRGKKYSPSNGTHPGVSHADVRKKQQETSMLDEAHIRAKKHAKKHAKMIQILITGRQFAFQFQHGPRL